MTETWLRRAAGNYASALGLTALALWVELLLARSAGTHFIFLALSLAIALSALVGGVGPALLATLLSVLLAHIYLIGPGGLMQLPAPIEEFVIAFFTPAWTGVALLTG